MSVAQTIVSEPTVLHGQARVAGTRIPASLALDSLESGMSISELLEEFPALTHEGVNAALAEARREAGRPSGGPETRRGPPVSMTVGWPPLLDGCARY